MGLEMPSPNPSGWGPAPWALLPRTDQPSCSLCSIKHPSRRESAFPNSTYLCPRFLLSLSWFKTKPTAVLPVFNASNKKFPLTFRHPPATGSFLFLLIDLPRVISASCLCLSPPSLGSPLISHSSSSFQMPTKGSQYSPHKTLGSMTPSIPSSFLKHFLHSAPKDTLSWFSSFP